MKKIFLLYLSLLVGDGLFSQAPGIRWQRTLGGSNEDEINFTLKTIDNGILSIGQSYSNDGVFNSNHGYSDTWIEKFTSDGITVWRRMLGGNDFDIPYSYVYNPDGSIVILCTSKSNNGDITNNHGGTDVWLFKLNNAGNLVWQKSFGGSADDFGKSITKTPGGDYVIAGGTISNDGDVTGNHGGVDGWILKVSDGGELIWQKCLGGSSNEGSSYLGDFGSKVMISSDGSIYAFFSTTSNDGDVSGFHGDNDIWMVKVNNAGGLVWQKCLGGSGAEALNDISLLNSGNFIMAGYTSSVELPSYHGSDSNRGDIYVFSVDTSGDVLWQKCYGSLGDDWKGTQIVSVEDDGGYVLASTVKEGNGDIIGHHGNDDLWIFKINSVHDIEWQKTMGGTYYEDFYEEYGEGLNVGNIGSYGFGYGIKTMDNGFLFTAIVQSNDGDVTNFHASGAENLPDLWEFKLSANGSLEWQRCLGGSKSDIAQTVPLEIEPNTFILGGNSYSNDGDIQKNYGKNDGLLIKFGSVTKIKGTVFIDNNGDGIKDTDDPMYSGGIIQASKGGPIRTVVPYQGNFEVTVDTGTYNTSFIPNPPYYTVFPVSQTSSLATYFNVDSFSFALHRIPNIRDLVVNVVPLTIGRPGFNLSYDIYCRNIGEVTIPSGQIVFAKDSRLQLLSSAPVADNSVGDTLKWNYIDLKPSDTLRIRLNFRLSPPPITNIQDTLYSVAFITPVGGDLTPYDDTSVLRQRVLGSLDPNDKAENLGGSIAKERVLAGDYITYFIRFQNTGTDTAFNVVVRDTLDNKLDWSSFQMITSSHPYTLQIEDQNKLIWTFYGINLPDSNVNEPGSHGYIAYRVKADNTLNIGATFLNRASIYFDFNLPVATNYASMIVGTPIALPLKLLDFDAQYRQPDANLKWTTTEEANVDRFIIERGGDPFHYVAVGTVGAKGGSPNGKIQYQFLDKLTNVNGDRFYYRLKVIDRDNKLTYSNIALVKRNGIVINEVIVNPNPTRNGLVLANINYNKNTQAVLSVTDMQGRVLNTRIQNLTKGYNVISLARMRLPAGAYFLQVKTEGKQMVTRFVIAQ